MHRALRVAVQRADAFDSEPYARRGWLGKATCANVRPQRPHAVTISVQHVSRERTRAIRVRRTGARGER